MQVARVVGDVVATRKDASLTSLKLLLLQPVDEHRRPVLVPEIAELLMRGEEIDLVPEAIEQLRIADHRRIEADLHRLRRLSPQCRCSGTVVATRLR